MVGRVPSTSDAAHTAQQASIALVLVLAGCNLLATGRPPRPIPSGETSSLVGPSVMHESVPHAPIADAPTPIPSHPYMAAHGASCMHGDPYTSNTYSWPGPVGPGLEVNSRANGFLGGECPTINFDRHGRIVTVCVRARTPSLVLFDPNTMRVLDRHILPSRRVPLLRFRAMAEDTSGGAYFYLDERDRAVVGTSDGAIDVISVRETTRGPRFVVDQRIDLRAALALPNGDIDKITAVMPDWSGNYWFVGREGTVGIAGRDGVVASIHLLGEEIENSFSIGPDGSYIVSDHALYRFTRGTGGAPVATWRATYDRGSRRKVGQINRGSGTTPTLLGDRYVAIADNAEPRMNVVVYRRDAPEAPRPICTVPVFEPGASATENTLIGHGRSLIVENNAGYDIFMTMRRGRTSAPGLTRIDIREDESGCDLRWTSQVVSQTTVPKLSTATGLIYAYTKMPNAPLDADAFYFTAIDFQTGRTVFRVRTGTGIRYDNHWAAVTLAPDGSAFVGVLNGFVRVRDVER